MAEQNIVGGNHIAAGQRDRGIGVLTDNPPVSSKVYQNSATNSLIVYLPGYATTSGTAVDIIELFVPAGHYYEFTASGVTFGTAVVKAV